MIYIASGWIKNYCTKNSKRDINNIKNIKENDKKMIIRKIMML